MTEELKSCPFCGCPPKISLCHDSSFHSGHCSNEKCIASWYFLHQPKTLEEFKKAWNTRAEDKNDK